jgi:hypothetical protein
VAEEASQVVKKIVELKEELIVVIKTVATLNQKKLNVATVGEAERTVDGKSEGGGEMEKKELTVEVLILEEVDCK